MHMPDAISGLACDYKRTLLLERGEGQRRRSDWCSLRKSVRQLCSRFYERSNSRRSGDCLSEIAKTGGIAGYGSQPNTVHVTCARCPHFTALIRNAKRLHEIVQEEIAKGRKFIILGGGDGTISSVVDHFAYTSVVFDVLPLGTANSFARTLGVPLDLTGAIDVLVNGKVANIDLGKINEDYFANGSSIGMPAIVGRATPHGLKKAEVPMAWSWPTSSCALRLSAASSRSMVSRPRSRHSTF